MINLLREFQLTTQNKSIWFFSRDSPKKDIAKSYRKLAGKWHPDMFRYIDSLQRLPHERDLAFEEIFLGLSKERGQQ
jgi:hypothetical protein